MSKKRLFVVLGVHRGGTSLAAAALASLGVPFGDSLMEPDEDNPTGYWEDLDIVEFNNSILNALSMTWDSIGSVSTDQVDSLESAGFVQKGLSLLDDKFKKASVFGFKDPRTVRLLEFWRRVFVVFRCDVRFVLVIRDPVEVCASLTRRDGFDKEVGAAIWLEHMLPIAEMVDAAGLAIIDYADFTGNRKLAEKTMQSLMHFSGFTAGQLAVSRFLNEFIRFSTPRALSGTMCDERGSVVMLATKVYKLFRGVKGLHNARSENFLSVKRVCSTYRAVSSLNIRGGWRGSLSARALLYVRNSTDNDFNERSTVRCPLALDGRKRRLEFKSELFFNLDLSAPEPLRFDPADCPLIFAVSKIGVLDGLRHPVWESPELKVGSPVSRRSRDSFAEWLSPNLSGSYVGQMPDGGLVFFFGSNDPHISLKLPGLALSALRSGGVLWLDIAAQAISFSGVSSEDTTAQSLERLSQVSARLESTDEALEQTKAQSIERLSQIHALAARLESTDEALEQTKAQSIERLSQIHALAARLESTDAELEQARAQLTEWLYRLDDRQKRVTTVEAENREAIRRIEILARQREEALLRLAACQESIDAILTSRSWRMTAPFRWLSKTLRARS
jgi:hypothetical protein